MNDFSILKLAIGMLSLIALGYYAGYNSGKDKLHKQFKDDMKKINKFKKSLRG